jgi:hypothetical protein
MLNKRVYFTFLTFLIILNYAKSNENKCVTDKLQIIGLEVFVGFYQSLSNGSLLFAENTITMNDEEYTKSCNDFVEYKISWLSKLLEAYEGCDDSEPEFQKQNANQALLYAGYKLICTMKGDMRIHYWNYQTGGFGDYCINDELDYCT